MCVCVTAEGGRVRTDESQGADGHPVQEQSSSALRMAADPTQISTHTHSSAVKLEHVPPVPECIPARKCLKQSKRGTSSGVPRNESYSSHSEKKRIYGEHF